MKFLSSLLAAAFTASSLLFSPVNAFTNGTLLPAYMCGPTLLSGAAADGLPKSLGGVLPYFTLATNPFPNPVCGHLPNAPLDAGCGGQVNHTMLLVAGFHNRPLSIVPFKQVVHITVIAAASAANPNPQPGQIVPGATHILQIQSTPNDLGVFDDNTALDGTLVYAYDLTIQQRVGKFTAFGANMQAFPGCGPNAVGAVHNKLLSDTGHYDGLEWTAPPNLTPGDMIQFRGAAVTDAGFGAHSSTYPVVAPTNALPAKPTLTQVLVFGASKAFAFFVDENRGSATVKITSFTALAQLSATITTAAMDVPGVATTTVTPPLATQKSTCKTSPCKIDVAALLKAAGTTGGFMALTITATGTNNNVVQISPVSNAAIIQVGTLTTTTATTAAPTVAPTTAPTVAPTAVATTAAPTAAATTKAVATTKAASTAAPSTAAPTTVKPTTALATTVTPTTATPTTAIPTTAIPTTKTPTTAAAATGISQAAVAQHNTAASCWIIISGNVYDMTAYPNAHPGGTGQITNNCGNDATMAYGAIGAHKPAKLTTTTGIVLVGPLAVTAAKTVLFVQAYDSPSAGTNPSPQVVDQGFMVLCNAADETAMDQANMALAEDADNACAWQSAYAQVLVNADAANGAVIAAAVTDGTTGTVDPAATCTTTTTDNTAMVVGISVGVAVLVVGLVGIGAFVYLKKRSTQATSNQAMTNKMTSV